jgi:putative iron-regulated protein
MRLLGPLAHFDRTKKLAIAGVIAALFGACGDDGGGSIDSAPVNATYAANVHANYAESLSKAQMLKTAIDAFVAAPSQTTLDAAKTAWLASREPYGQTEVFRFYDGPIDNPEDGPEGAINAWPLDEVFIDYVENMPNAGIINNMQAFPTITKQVIADQNENGGEANISSGYHAIEFLLWGQDLSASGPGVRPFTDYTTLANADRRKQYLSLVTELLVDDLTAVTEAWADGADYRAEFESGGTDSIQKMLLGMGSLSGAELSGERMTVALDNRDQEDEHSCFSDNTHRDIRANALGIQNVFLGKYGATDGQGIEDLVRARDAALADRLKADIAASLVAIDAIPTPFDSAIDDDANGRPKVMAAIAALQKQTDTTVEAADALGITINLE